LDVAATRTSDNPDEIDGVGSSMRLPVKAGKLAKTSTEPLSVLRLVERAACLTSIEDKLHRPM
jgi:hypothetical protein